MGLLRRLFSAGAANFVDAVGNAIDKNVTSDEERQELENELMRASFAYEVEMKTLELGETKAFLADTDSARVNQRRIQESEHASWLAKNVHPLLAVGIISLTFFLYFWIIGFGQDYQPGQAMSRLEILSKHGVKDIVIYILGALTTVSTQVAAFYFGSSQGSKDKQQTLASITTRDENGA